MNQQSGQVDTIVIGDNFINSKIAIPKIEGRYEVITRTFSMNGGKDEITTATFKWAMINDTQSVPTWSGEFDWTKVIAWRPLQEESQ